MGSPHQLPPETVQRATIFGVSRQVYVDLGYDPLGALLIVEGHVLAAWQRDVRLMPFLMMNMSFNILAMPICSLVYFLRDALVGTKGLGF